MYTPSLLYEKEAEKEEADKSEVIPEDDPDLLQNRPAIQVCTPCGRFEWGRAWVSDASPGAQRAIVISAGVVFNLVLAFLAIFSSVSVNGVLDPGSP